jgi:hypothetical protein
MGTDESLHRSDCTVSSRAKRPFASRESQILYEQTYMRGCDILCRSSAASPQTISYLGRGQIVDDNPPQLLSTCTVRT